MTKTLLNVAFLISAAELDPASPRFYQHTVKCYHDLFGGFKEGGDIHPVALIKLPRGNKKILGDVIDFLLDHNVRPEIELSGIEDRVFKQAQQVKDMFRLFSCADVVNSNFTLLVREGWWVEATKDFIALLSHAVDTLESNPSVLSVAFEAVDAKGQRLSESFSAFPSLTSRPIVTRSRDLLLAAKMGIDHGQQLVNMSAEETLFRMMAMFSYSPAKFLAFNPVIAHST